MLNNIGEEGIKELVALRREMYDQEIWPDKFTESLIVKI